MLNKLSISSTTNWLLIGYSFDLFLGFDFTWRQWKNLTPVIFIWVYLHYPYRTILRGIKLLFSHFNTGGNSGHALILWLWPFLGVGAFIEIFTRIPNWPLTLSDLPAASWVLGLQVWATMSGKFFYYWQWEGVGLDGI